MANLVSISMTQPTPEGWSKELQNILNVYLLNVTQDINELGMLMSISELIERIQQEARDKERENFADQLQDILTEKNVKDEWRVSEFWSMLNLLRRSLAEEPIDTV